MLMADTMAIFFVVLGLLLAFPSLWLLCYGLWPDASLAASAKTDKNILKPFLVGLPVTAVMLVMAAAMKNLLGGLGNIAAGVLVSIYVVYAGTGVAGLATTIGQRLKSQSDAQQPWRATLRGSVVLALTYLLPILGWFVILPASIIVGTGAVTMSLFNLKTDKVAAVSEVNDRRVPTGTTVTADLP
ncbi:MAG: hypothetical protein L0229_14975 [Blastocatellia bacterium]|nr:hypothetical protein [Blastocatellia bacterium]